MLKLNWKSILLLSVLVSGLLISDCKKDDDDSPPIVEMNPVPLDAVSNLMVSDIGDAQNGTDLQVAFTKVSDETNVASYQIFVVPDMEASAFDLEFATALSADRSLVVNTTGADISTTFSANSKTSSGEQIENDAPYKIFVLTVSADTSEFLSTLSSASMSLTLTTEVDPGPKVKVTYIANDGVMIEFEGKKVVIDAINRFDNLSGWVRPSAAEMMDVENGVAPFDDIDVIMITHNHGDHYSTAAVQNYLAAHPSTKLIIPSGMESSFSAYASQIADFEVAKFERELVIENDISIDVLHIEHFDQFGNDFSLVESFAYVVHLGDKKLLHTGDIDYVDSQLDVFNLLDDSIDVVFIPTFGNLVNSANRDALINNVNPANIVCLHFLVNTMTTTLFQVSNTYPDAETFTVPFTELEY